MEKGLATDGRRNRRRVDGRRGGERSFALAKRSADRGALTPGYRADIAVYDMNPNDIDPSRQYEDIEKGFSNALYIDLITTGGV